MGSVHNTLPTQGATGTNGATIKTSPGQVMKITASATFTLTDGASTTIYDAQGVTGQHDFPGGLRFRTDIRIVITGTWSAVYI